MPNSSRSRRSNFTDPAGAYTRTLLMTVPVPDPVAQRKR
jgi:hypothetical protein